jgi:hypothetical protein
MGQCLSILNLNVNFILRNIYITVDPVYSERVGAAKSVQLRRVFTINVFNLTIN